MDRKKELKQQFKETSVEAGVYKIKNDKTIKYLLEVHKNFKTLNGI